MNRVAISRTVAAELGQQSGRVALNGAPGHSEPSADLARLREAILDQVGRDGFTVIENLPDASDNTVLALMHLLGMPVHEANAGPMIMDVKPQHSEVPVNSSSYHTWNRFDYHTDLSFTETPPDLVAMICVQPDARREGRSLVADARSCLPALSGETLAELQTPQFSFGAPAHYRGEVLGKKAVLTRNQNGRFDVRVRFDKLTADSEPGRRALQALYEALDECKLEFFLEKNSGCVLDNRRVVHGRSAFTPTFDATDRHLKRIYGMRNWPDPS